MNDEFRERFFTPFVMPVTILGALLLIGFSLSRVLLAVSELGAAAIAMLAAGYIMAMAFFIEARRRIPARTLGIALAIGLIGLVASGAVASAVGMRELHAPEGAGGGEAEEASVASPNLPEGQVFVADDIFYAEAPEVMPAGDLTFVIDNQGTIVHNVVIEELDDTLVVEAEGGQVETGQVTLEPGDYTYYCDIPGHREAGMEGTVTVSEDAGGGEGDAEDVDGTGGDSETEQTAFAGAGV